MKVVNSRKFDIKKKIEEQQNLVDLDKKTLDDMYSTIAEINYDLDEATFFLPIFAAMGCGMGFICAVLSPDKFLKYLGIGMIVLFGGSAVIVPAWLIIKKIVVNIMAGKASKELENDKEELEKLLNELKNIDVPEEESERQLYDDLVQQYKEQLNDIEPKDNSGKQLSLN